MNPQKKQRTEATMPDSNNSNSDSSHDRGETPSIAMVQCDDCGHRLPEANMSIHRARCTHIHRGVEPPLPSPSSSTSREEGRTREEEQRGWEGRANANDNGGENEAVEESISGEYSSVYPSHQSTLAATTAGAATSPSIAATPAPSAPPAPATVENHWVCPRCTLHNSLDSNTCDACLYQRGSPPPQQAQRQNNNANTNGWELVEDSNRNNNGTTQGGFRVNISEVDPNTVNTAVNVASGGIFGALVGGPVGALVAGGTAAALGRMQQLQARRQQQQQQHQNGTADGSANNTNTNTGRRPFFAMTTTTYTSTPWGGTQMSVTSNASGQRRTMSIRDGARGGGIRLNQMSQTDRHILQMLISNAVRIGSATPETANQMSLEELLQQFGVVPDHDNLRQGGGRAATPQQIERNSTLHTLDKASIAELSENQSTCNICLEEFKTGDEMRKLTYCEHTYHRECSDRWLERVASCPICKHELNSDGGQQQQQGVSSS